MKIARRSCFEGCLLGGAVGDALGAPIEFSSLAEIRQKFGPGGLTDYAPAYGRLGAITDDTQMTMFTAEALIRGQNRWKERGICHPAGVAHRAYLRWLFTQERRPADESALAASWLLELPAMHSRRGPGTTCLSALSSGRIGSLAEPINDRKGCGGLMRVGPVGLAWEPEQAFEQGCEFAAITHGHPSGYLAAGFYAAVISGVARSHSIETSIETARRILLVHAANAEVLAAVDAAMAAAARGPSASRLESLGQGWVAEEALAITLYCALSTKGFRDAVLLAVNHGGDSDSTGALTGGLVGTLLGREAIPAEWISRLELGREIADLAFDLFRHFGGPYIPLGPTEQVPTLEIESSAGQREQIFDEIDPADWRKYPGY